MLSNILDKTMSKAMKIENITRASRFANTNKNVNDDNLDENELLMLQKISQYVKPEFLNNEDDEIFEYIVEKPEQKAQIFDFENIPKSELPFFKSIEVKLGKTV